jgi:hypothetical protein
MKAGDLVPLTPLAKKYLKYLLSFFVTLGAGLSPLWVSGLGFHAMLDVLPRDVQDVIPWASFLMSITAVAVHFFGSDALKRRRLDQGFKATFVVVFVLLFVLYGVYKSTVIRIHIPGAGGKVSYLIGSTMLPTCECAKRGLQIRECIGFAITANPDDVAACYPLEQVSTRATVLSMLYMLLMFALGMLIGLAVLKEQTHRARKRNQATAREDPAKASA